MITKTIFPLFLLTMVVLSSCAQKEKEQEIDYDHMVMADEEEEWSPANTDMHVADCDPQEFTILDPEKKNDTVFELQ